ncbi:MAG: chromate transporter [Pelatocladus maniniholoensis HA4357-MV3]|jgi:chromate transporter|uniref:Chromate transporter n=1 Tax=Pelatocladus maniniholoensis HA4357-MV3 TaxID=1117104 RepID=A0A9E3H5X0_9NOST|nr:chromate transporter [Pelatocladus maniniholoensis HA4357-MV3]BAZ69769.1 chromate ion transporter family protein [Fischerella sp. NIES-4106]
MLGASSNQVQQTNPPSLGVLVAVFAGIGARAFGGSIPTHVLPFCLKRGWLTDSECLEALNWCRSLPGAGGTNLSAYLGYYWQKTVGAILATFALVLPGSVVILLASKLLSQLPEHIVQASLTAVVAASLGLLLDLTWRLAKPSITNYVQVLVAIATFILVGIFRVPIPLVLVLLVPIAWYFNRRTQTSH